MTHTPIPENNQAQLLDCFCTRISATAMRGPLAQMRTGLEDGAGVDLFDLAADQAECAAILDAVLQRTDSRFALDSQVLNGNPKNLKQRLHSLQANNQLFLRDTGMDGLYLGFPFLVFRPEQARQDGQAQAEQAGQDGTGCADAPTPPGSPNAPNLTDAPDDTGGADGRDDKDERHPLVMPALLWPIRIDGDVLSGEAGFGYDAERGEVLLNPLLWPLLGPERLRAWQDAAGELPGMDNAGFRAVLEALCSAAETADHDFQPLNPQERDIQCGVQHLLCSAVLFHSDYTGQAVAGDLRQLRSFAAIPGAMGAVLNLHERPQAGTGLKDTGPEKPFPVTVMDPSQEEAVRQSADPRGLVVECPPGTGRIRAIANMAAQAVGNGRSVLVVCRKKAALDAVREKLVDAGLKSRMIMVTDYQKDRLPVIKAVRTQVETIFGRGLSMPARMGRERKECSDLSERLENELDAAHHALHRIDEKAESSYRGILSELMLMKAEFSPPFRLGPQVAALLGDLSRKKVQNIADSCTPLLRLWLPSAYEDNPLGALKAFTPGEDELRAMRGAFDDFRASEAERHDYFAKTATPVPPGSTLPVTEWVDHHADQFKSLLAPELRLAAKWLPLFKTGGRNQPSARGGSIVSELEHVAEALDKLTLQDYSAAFSPRLAEQTAAALSELSGSAALESSSAPKWRKLLPPALLARLRLELFAKKCGLGKPDQRQLAELGKAVALEQAARPLREKLRSIQALLDIPQVAAGEVRDLYPEAAGVLRQVRLFGSLLSSLADLPGSENLEYAMAIGSTGELQRFLEEYEVVAERGKRVQRSLLLLQALEPWFDGGWIASCRELVEKAANVDDLLAPVADNLNNIPSYMQFRLWADGLDPVCLDFLRLLRAGGQDLNAMTAEDSAGAAADSAKFERDFRSLLRYEALCAWKERIERENPALDMDGKELKLKAGLLEQSRRKMLDLNHEYLAHDIDVARLGPSAVWEDITRLTSRAMRLDEFVTRGREAGLFELRPVWLMNPDAASSVLPLAGNMFDTVIYGDATLLPVEYAVPTLYRARSAVVLGDEMQSPPDGSSSACPDAEVRDCADLVQLARRRLPRTSLRMHYRSEYGELVQFSNAAFYGGRLQVPALHSRKESLAAAPLRVVAVNSKTARPDEDEARAVMEILEELWSCPGRYPSGVGVVTFSREQANLIKRLLEEKAAEDEKFRRLLMRESALDGSGTEPYTKTGAKWGAKPASQQGNATPFFVKCAENMQGEARDVIIISSVCGKHADGGFARDFGGLDRPGGERLLNMAVTGAHRRVVLVNSLPVEDVSGLLASERPPATPREYFQLYCAYARAVYTGSPGMAGRVLSRLTAANAANAGNAGAKPADDGFRRTVGACIEKAGWSLAPTDRSSVFGLDFLLENEHTGRFVMGIECDSPSHPLLAGAVAREVWRRSMLGHGVPRVYRASSRAWLENPSREERLLREAAEQAFRKSDAAG